MPVETEESPHDIILRPLPTQAAAITSHAVIVILVGGMGSGKSMAAGPLGMLVHAARNLEVLTRKNTPLYCCIIRDTHENIKHSVVPLFRDFFSEYHALQSMHQWKNDYKHLEIFTDPVISVDLFGIDDLPSVTRLQGTAYAYIMLDDVVPYTDSQRTNAGIIEDVYNAALVRCARQKAVRDGLEPKLMISSNMPDEDHWFYHRLLKPKDGPVHPETPLITKQTFYLQIAENIHLAEVSRQATKAAYMNDPVAYARFVEGKTATKYPGKRVAEYFDAEWHVSKVPLEPQEGVVGFISFDSWGHPAAVIGQQWPNGKIWVLDECQGAADIRHLIADYVKPLLMTPRWRDKVFAWRYMGDVTMNRHDQSDVNNSSKKAVEEAFKDPHTGHNAYFEEGPSQWQRIKAGFLHTLRSTAADGGPLVLIDGFACKGLVSALKGRWHYGQNNAGVVNWNLPIKDDASHVADCLANASCLLAAWDPPKQKNRKIEREQRGQSKKRAASYAA